MVVIDTELDDALRAEGDARELGRAVQDLRKQTGLELDDTIDLWLSAPVGVMAALEPYLAKLGDDTLAAEIHRESGPSDAPATTQQVSGGEVGLAIRRRESAS